jgi:hypothetical protein
MVGSTKNGDVSQPLRPPEISTTLLALWNAAYQAAPPGNNATMTTLLPERILGFPPVHTGQGRRASPNALQEGKVAPSDVTTSVSAKPTGISPDPRSPTSDAPSCSIILVAHQHAPPRPCRHRRCLTVANETGPRGSRRTSRERETAGVQDDRHAGGTRLHRRLRAPAGRIDGSKPGTVLLLRVLVLTA